MAARDICAAYSRAEEALEVGRNQLVRRALWEGGRGREDSLAVVEQADLIVDVVDQFGLRPEVISEERPQLITEADLGIVCYQAVMGSEATFGS